MRVCVCGIGELAVIQTGIKSVAGKKLVMPALFDNMSVTHYEDYIRFAYCGEPVGNYKACAAFHHCSKRVLDFQFGSCIY